MIRFKQIACALALFGLYALIAGRAPAFSTKGAILAAKIGYNAFSMLAWGGFAGHSFEINSAGDVTVRKFGNSAERLITGQLKLNGEIWDTH